jgi:hypothetical protein
MVNLREEINFSNSSNWVGVSEYVTLILLFAALGVFIYLAVIPRNIRSFQLQISVFIVIWISGELINALQNSRIFNFPSLQEEFGLQIHVIAMVFFSMLLWIRFYYSERSGKKMIDNVDDNNNVDVSGSSSNVKHIDGRTSRSSTQAGDESTTTDGRADNTSDNS